MKGIIVNNILNVLYSSLRWAVILFFLAEILSFIPSNDCSLFSLMIFTIVPILIFYSILDMQDKNCSEQYMISMPGGKSAMVKGMYVSALLYMALILVIEALLIYIPCYFFAPEYVNLSQLLWLPTILTTLPLLALAVLFPIYYKFEMKVLRAAVSVFAVLLFGSFFVSMFSDGGHKVYWNSDSAIFGLKFGAEWVVPVLILVGVLALYFVSMALSIKLYKSRR